MSASTLSSVRDASQTDAIALDAVIEQINQPQHQGIPLLRRDYIALIVVTILIPIGITIWGGAVA